jgi:hypothetical protein
MADTASASTDITSAPKDDHGDRKSFWNITQASRSTDPARWNKDWEKFLLAIVSSNVYATMGAMFTKGSMESSVLLDFTQTLKVRVCKLQQTLAKVWDMMGKTDHFETAWLLLDEKERKKHLLKGLEKACKQGTFWEDCRALCPEITTSSMLKLNGQAFIDFMRSLTTAIKGAGMDDPYFLPSEWWYKAVEDVPPSLSEKFEPSTFTLLTLMRNEFISEYIELPLVNIKYLIDDLPFFFPAHFMLESGMSVLHDLSNGSPGMDPVKELMDSDGAFAHAHSRTMAMLSHKPVIRCENCTKRPEDIDGNPKFMVCSACKLKLDFVIHYCSPYV